MDEAALVERAQAGDLEAFAELVRRHERGVRAVLARLLEDERDVEEATQDTFVQAWRNLDRFRREASAFTWLYRIAVNEALQRLRRRQPPTKELEETTEREIAAPNPPPLGLGDFLAAKLRELPVEYRLPLVLRDLQGLSNREIADVLGISLAAAKSRIHRARMQIRAELESWEATN
jgi:RNA polymerase sigma-70 factor, ECF subfamily